MTTIAESDATLLSAFLSRVQAKGLIPPANAALLSASLTGGLLAPAQATAEADERQQGSSYRDLPIPPETLDRLPAGDMQLAALILAQLIRSGPDEVSQHIAALKLQQLLDLHEQAQDDFQKRNHLLAWLLLAGGLTLRGWHEQQRRNVRVHILQQAMMGSRGKIDRPATATRLLLTFQQQDAYLQGFVDDVAVHRLAGEPRAPEYVEHRANQYGGSGRATFYREFEQGQHDAGMAGWVVEYLTRDDPAVCIPCDRAKGFYLPGRGAMPGEVCEGRGNCRCRRIPRYLPDVYASLRAGPSGTGM